MKILAISGSPRAESSNTRLLEATFDHFQVDGFVYKGLAELPIFQPGIDCSPWPSAVIECRNAVSKADAIIICTPVYIFNIPAILKNALEWLTTSGEMDRKPLLPITYTPYAPRGEKAMQSLLWSLTALNARIITQLSLYKTDLELHQDRKLVGDESIEILEEALKLLGCE